MKERIDGVKHYIGPYIIDVVCRIRNVHYLHAVKN